ncbi:MAG: hypothetical protein QF662_05795, partial [Phycisphaerae bacterium]|nr:hypothetical protein [Phycisphaerae bacterium]
LNVLRPADCRDLRLLTNKVAWKEIQIDGKPAPASAIYLKNGWLRFTPPGAAVFTISASADLKATRRGRPGNRPPPPKNPRPHDS